MAKQGSLFSALTEMSTEDIVSELKRRYESTPPRPKVRAPSDVLVCLDPYVNETQEHFVCVTLNGSHEVIKTHLVTMGLVNRTVVHPREVFRCALFDNAAAIIVAHNHPSGSLEPSAEDQEVTSRLVSAGQLMGMPVLDHVIVSFRGYYSFLEHDAL